MNAPLFHPWSFIISQFDQPVGKIIKKWSGIGKEIFTDADNFNIVFPQKSSTELKGFLIGVLFLIDLLYVEKSNSIIKDAIS